MKLSQEAIRGPEGDSKLLPGPRADVKAYAPTTILRAVPRRARRFQGGDGAAEEDQGQVQKQEGQSLLRSGGTRRVGLRRSEVVFDDNGEHNNNKRAFVGLVLKRGAEHNDLFLVQYPQ